MKKTIAIISATLVGLLLIATIIMACTTHTAYIVDIKKPYTITIYKGSNEHVLTADNEKFDTIIELYNKSAKENNLSALFQGATGFKKEVKNKQVAIDDIINRVDGKYVVCFNYGGSAKTLQIDGKDYVNTLVQQGADTTVKYNELYVEVDNTANYTEYTVYLVAYGQGQATDSYWQIKLIAEQAELYSYIAENF